MTRSLRRRLSISIRKVRRHHGDSFPRKAAYIFRSKEYNPRTGTWYDFQQKGTIEARGMEGWDGTLEELIEAAVMSEPERRPKVVEGREAIKAIPEELSVRERLALVKKCAAYLARKFTVAVLYAIHPPPKGGDPRNWHAHFLFTSRKVVFGHALGPKTRELDDLKTGGQHIEAIRAWWCAAANLALRQAGYPGDLEHKSYYRLREKGEPGSHNGERRTSIERRHGKRPISDLDVPTFETAPEAQGQGVPSGNAIEIAGSKGPDAGTGHKSGEPSPPAEHSKASVQPELAFVAGTMAPEAAEPEESSPERPIWRPLSTPDVPAPVQGPTR
jgi:hypothetical protein